MSLSCEKWGGNEFIVFLRSYCHTMKFGVDERIPSFSIDEIARECRKWLLIFIQTMRIHEYRHLELEEYLWNYLIKHPWKWDDGVISINCYPFLTQLIMDYIRKYPRKYRTIDEV